MNASCGRRIVIGVGNPDRGDDAAGRAVARLLRDSVPAGTDVFEQDGEATKLLQKLEDSDEAFLIDACVSGAIPGTIRRFDVSATALPQAQFGMSTHGFGLGEGVELARALGALPSRCIVYAIEGAAFDAGAPLSVAVNAAVAEVAERLRAELVSRQPESRTCTKRR